MLEITYTDMFLFAWASIMTGLYFKSRHEERMVRIVFMHLIENKEAREQMLEQYEKQTKEST
jgi:hypothetical protein